MMFLCLHAQHFTGTRCINTVSNMWINKIETWFYHHPIFQFEKIMVMSLGWWKNTCYQDFVFCWVLYSWKIRSKGTVYCEMSKSTHHSKLFEALAIWMQTFEVKILLTRHVQARQVFERAPVSISPKGFSLLAAIKVNDLTETKQNETLSPAFKQ